MTPEIYDALMNSLHATSVAYGAAATKETEIVLKAVNGTFSNITGIIANTMHDLRPVLFKDENKPQGEER